jgi:hypothetical protein
MSNTFEDLTFTDDMPLDLLRELIAEDVLPEYLDPAYVTREDMEAFHADMQAMPLDLPTSAEIEEMARVYGLAALPF